MSDIVKGILLGSIVWLPVGTVLGTSVLSFCQAA